MCIVYNKYINISKSAKIVWFDAQNVKARDKSLCIDHEKETKSLAQTFILGGAFWDILIEYMKLFEGALSADGASAPA